MFYRLLYEKKGGRLCITHIPQKAANGSLNIAINYQAYILGSKIIVNI